MTKIFADLHLHTTRSDGTKEPNELLEIASETELEAIALTDHDSFHTDFSAPIIQYKGMDVINGIELRVRIDELEERVDLLGYGVTPSKKLEQLTNAIEEDRNERARRMLSLIEKETGVKLDKTIVEKTNNIGRPHIARLIEQSNEIKLGYNEAFNELIGDNGPCYTSRNIPSFENGVNVLLKSCEFISLAHPYRYDNPRKVLSRARQLDGVECLYPYSKIPEHIPEHIDELAVDWFDLVMTGGTDDHKGESIGTVGIMESFYKEFIKEAGLEYYSTHF